MSTLHQKAPKYPKKNIIMITDLVMALLGTGHHTAVLPGAVSHGDLLTPGVANILSRGALHVLGGARCLLVIFKIKVFLLLHM